MDGAIRLERKEEKGGVRYRRKGGMHDAPCDVDACYIVPVWLSVRYCNDCCGTHENDGCWHCAK